MRKTKVIACTIDTELWKKAKRYGFNLSNALQVGVLRMIGEEISLEEGVTVARASEFDQMRKALDTMQGRIIELNELLEKKRN